jgi:hypothetical protein
VYEFDLRERRTELQNTPQSETGAHTQNLVVISATRFRLAELERHRSRRIECSNFDSPVKQETKVAALPRGSTRHFSTDFQSAIVSPFPREIKFLFIKDLDKTETLLLQESA